MNIPNFFINEKMLLSLFDLLPVLVTVIDLENYEIIFTNKLTESAFGNAKGKKCFQYFHLEREISCEECNKNLLFDSQKNPAGIVFYETKNPRNNRWYEIQTQAIRWEDGRWVRLEIATDISKLKHDEKKLLRMLKQENLVSQIAYIFNTIGEFEEKLMKTFELLGKHTEASRVFIFEKNYSNNTFSNTYEWFNIDIESKKNNFQNVPSECFADWEKDLTENSVIKLKISNENTSEFWKLYFQIYKVQSLLALPIFVENEFWGYIGYEFCYQIHNFAVADVELLHTISLLLSIAYRRKKILDALRQSEMRLKEANSTKDKFFSIVAHDLKNPIYALADLTEFLYNYYDDWENEKRKKFIEYIYASAKQVFMLVENLLMWSRTQTGRIPFSPQIFNLKEIVCDNIALFQALAVGKKISLENKISENISVFVDLQMLNTVFRNLISNAIKFTPSKGEILIDAEVLDNEIVEIKVSDSGVGISKENQEKLFRIDTPHTTLGTNDEKGTGLGLILCKEFIEKHGGKLKIESEINKGTTFIFTVSQKTVTSFEEK